MAPPVWSHIDNGMVRSWAVEDNSTYHRPALDGREFMMRLKLLEGSQIIGWQHKFFVDAVKQVLRWRSHAKWAEIVDYEGKAIISRTRMARLWRAADEEYGKPTIPTPYRVRAEVICPGIIHEYLTLSLANAINYASWWHENGWDDPAWVEVRGPNGRIVVSRMLSLRMYHGEVKAYGGSIVTSMIEVSFVDGIRHVVEHSRKRIV